MPQRFVFLEITDPEISGFINGVREILDKKKIKNTNIHVTLRGPYGDDVKITPHDMNVWMRLLAEEPVRIGGCGRFVNQMSQVLYLKVTHKNFEKIWDKPDYSDRAKYSVNPHITIYEGQDELFASLVEEFIKGESLSLPCRDYRLTVHEQKQRELFETVDATYRPPLDLLKQGAISLTFLGRLERLVYNYRQAKQSK